MEPGETLENELCEFCGETAIRRMHTEEQGAAFLFGSGRLAQ
jgi:hypothetical protein